VSRKLDTQMHGDILVATIRDRRLLDETNIQYWGKEMFDLIDHDHRKKIVLDCSRCDYMSSAALGKLITMDKKVAHENGRWVLCNIHPEIYKVLETIRLHKIFDIQPNLDAALQIFA
jgi:anti-sigma B factor antagonist